jgi:hypothetical protein
MPVDKFYQFLSEKNFKETKSKMMPPAAHVNMRRLAKLCNGMKQ